MKYNTVNRRNQKAKWKLLIASAIIGATAIIFPFALDVINPTNDYFPRAQVVKAERESILIPRMSETVEQTIRRIAKETCDAKNLDEYCVNDLVAMAWVESRFNCKAVGDGGKSHGCYQIHRGFHPQITVAQAQNPEFAMNWTLNRLVAHGYPEFRSYAIRKHNGSATNPKTQLYLNSVNNFNH